jgi:hypothetical protein
LKKEAVDGEEDDDGGKTFLDSFMEEVVLKFVFYKHICGI